MGRCFKSLPSLLVPLLVEAIKFSQTLGPIQKDLDVLELFAIKMWISKSCELAGLDSRAFDKKFTSSHDFLQKKGYHNAVHGTIRLRIGGCLWAALNCMPWIFKQTLLVIYVSLEFMKAIAKQSCSHRFVCWRGGMRLKYFWNNHHDQW